MTIDNLSIKTVLRPVAIAVVALMATACAVGPDYQQPASVQLLSVKYDQGWQSLPEQTWAQSGEWWQAFGDEDLTALVELANRNNLTLAQAEARFRTAQGQLRFSRGDYSLSLRASVDGTRSGGSDRSVSENYSAGLGISWEPDLWGRIRRQVESDAALLQGRDADLAAAQLSIQLAVVISYINVRALDQQLLILEETLETYNRSTQLTRNQYDAGIVSRADVIQAETQLQSLRNDLYTLQNQRALEENAVAALLGLAPVDFTLAPAEIMPDVPAIPAQIPSQLIARRPDVVAAERNVAAANADIGVAIAAWLPSISISATRGLDAQSFNDLWNAPVHFWSLGPSLAQTLFDGGKRDANQDIAVARYDEQVAIYRQTVLDSLRDVENALASNAILAEQGFQQDKLVALAEENQRVITNRYKSGLVSFLEMATAQNVTLNARRGRVSVVTNRLAAAAKLAAAIGGSWQVGDEAVQSVTAHSNKTAER